MATPSASSPILTWEGVLGATTTILVTTLEDSIWLTPFVAQAATIHIAICHAVTFVASFTALSTVIATVTVLIMHETESLNPDDSMAEMEWMLPALGGLICASLALFFYIKAMRKRRRKQQERAQHEQQACHNNNNNNNTNNDQQQHVNTALDRQCKWWCCWMGRGNRDSPIGTEGRRDSLPPRDFTTADAAVVRPLLHTIATTTQPQQFCSTLSHYEEKQQQQQHQAQLVSSNLESQPPNNQDQHQDHNNNYGSTLDADDIRYHNDHDAEDTSSSTAYLPTISVLTRTPDEVLATESIITATTGQPPQSNDNNDNDSPNDHHHKDSSANNRRTDTTTTTVIRPWLIMSLTILGALDEISYFPGLIVGQILTPAELILGTVLASLIMVTFVVVCLAKCGILVYMLDQIPLYGIIGAFAILLFAQAIWDLTQ